MKEPKCIFDYDRKTRLRRVDRIYVREGLPRCTHEAIAVDERDDIIKCIDCEMVFLFQTVKEFETFEHRFIYN